MFSGGDVLHPLSKFIVSYDVANRAEVSLTFHSLSFVIRLTLEVLTFAQAAECIHKSYDVSAERIMYCNFQWFDD